MVEQLSFRQKLILWIFAFLFIFTFAYYSYFILASKEKIYYVCFKSSVNGLKEGSPVSYKGVEIGFVSSIEVVLPEADLVKVAIKIKPSFPVYSNYRASLSARGFSGYFNIDLSKDHSLAQVELPIDSVILSRSESISDNLFEAVYEAKQFVHKLNMSLSEGGAQKINKNIDIIADNITNTSYNVMVLLNNINSEIDNLFGVANHFSSKIRNDYSMYFSHFNTQFSNFSSVFEGFAKKVFTKSSSKVGFWRFL